MESHDDVRHPLARRLEQLERRLKVAATGCMLTIAVATLAAWQRSATTEVLQVRALIVVDQAGRERVVLGAPIPDLAAGKRRGVSHGLLILDENGRDRVAVGAPKPDPQIHSLQARRISPSTGIQINNLEGNERGGFGYLELGRVTLGLDWDGDEAVTMSARPEGAALRINGPNRGSRMFLSAVDSLTRLSLFDRAGERVRFLAPASRASTVEHVTPPPRADTIRRQQ